MVFPTVLMVFWTVISVRFFLAGDGGDFQAFYVSGANVRQGVGWYTGIGFANMNPPILSVTVFRFLAHLTRAHAELLWTLAGVASIALTVWTLQQRRLFSSRAVMWLTIGLCLSYPAQVVWQRGQITWFLLYPMTRAWLAYRDGQRIRTGAWLAPVIAVKPICALLPFCLGWPVLVTAGAGSAALTLAGIAWTGWAPWVEWMQSMSAVRWYAFPLNASVWAVLMRGMDVPARGVAPLSILPAAWVGAALLCGGLLIVTAWRLRGDPDRRWLIGGIFTLALSPLGWIYYLPLFFGSIGALLARPDVTRWAWVGVIAAASPLPLSTHISEVSTLRFVTVGSLYFWGLLCLWIACMTIPSRDGQRRWLAVR
jgi:hypothetical protein